jgi:hypothetical protein
MIARYFFNHFAYYSLSCSTKLMRASVRSIMALAEALGSDGTLSTWTSRVLRLVLMSRARTDSDLHVEKALFSFSKRKATSRENMESGI